MHLGLPRAFRVLVAGCAVFAAVACASRTSDQRQYTLQGQVLAVDAAAGQATVKHEEIKGFMPAMTMPYKVKESALLVAVKPGDLINATLVVMPNDAFLAEIRKVGEAPLEKPAAE